MSDFEQRYELLVEEAYSDGGACAEAYCQAYDLREKLGKRLGTDGEDKDIVALVEAMERVQKAMCRWLLCG